MKSTTKGRVHARTWSEVKRTRSGNQERVQAIMAKMRQEAKL